MDWDPFDDVDRNEDDDPAVLRQRAIERARTLDPRVVICLGCRQTCEDWITRQGLTGEGYCRTCMTERNRERANARAFMVHFKKALEGLWKLRKERDERVAKEIADVPF
jgi:hypothetical protein